MAPSSGWVQINKGEGTTYVRDVVLNLFCVGADQVQIVNGTDPTGETLQALGRQIPWTLSTGYGTKTVTVRFELDGAYSSNYSTSIYYDNISNYTQTGGSGKAMDNLWTLICSASSFKTWTETSTLTAAKARCYRYMYDAPHSRPYCLIEEDRGYKETFVGDGSYRQFEAGGSFKVRFVADPKNVLRPINWQVEALQFKADVESIIDDIKLLTGTGSYLCLEEIEQVEPVTIGSDDDITTSNVEDVTIETAYVVRWR